MVGGKRVVALVQTRLSSSRLPGKALLELEGKTLMQRVVERAQAAEVVDQVWLCTSTHPADDVVEYKALDLGLKVYRGALEDCLERFVGASQEAQATIIVRVTGDNPLTESRFIDLGVRRLVEGGLDYLDFTNIPYGAHVWVFTRQALLRAAAETQEPYYREHIVPWFYDNPERFNILRWENPIPALRRPDVRITLDNLDDFVWLCRMFHHFRGQEPVALEEVIAYWDSSTSVRA